MRWNILALAVVLFFAVAAGACPVCDSYTGEQVRAGIFDDSFGQNLLATIAPFILFLGAVAAIHFGWPFPRASRAARPARPAQEPPAQRWSGR